MTWDVVNFRLPWTVMAVLIKSGERWILKTLAIMINVLKKTKWFVWLKCHDNAGQPGCTNAGNWDGDCSVFTSFYSWKLFRFNVCKQVCMKVRNFQLKFWKQEARTIEVARKRIKGWYLNPDLKYHEIKHCCIHGGQWFKSQGKWMRNVWWVVYI